MQDNMTINITPLQIILTLAFQLWIILFPILILRKLNNLTEIITQHFGDGGETPE